MTKITLDEFLLDSSLYYVEPKTGLIEAFNFLKNNELPSDMKSIRILEHLDLDNPEALNIFNDILKRLEKSPNKYSEYIMIIVRQYYRLDPFDTSKDEEINTLPPDDILECLHRTKMIGVPLVELKSWIAELYKVDYLISPDSTEIHLNVK